MEISPFVFVYMVLAVVACIGALYLRNRQEKIATTHIRVELIKKSGQSEFSLIKEDTGFIDLSEAGAPSGKKYKSFPIADIAMTEVPYPEGWPPFLRTRIKKVIFHEGSWEPVSNRGEDPVFSPVLLANMRKEKFTELSVKYSETIQDLEDRLHRALTRMMSPTIVYIMLGGCLVFAAVAAYAALVASGIIGAPEIGPVAP